MRTDALEGLRVLDLGQIWAGPLCVHMLGDMGAEIVRVETRGRAVMSGRPEFGPDDPPEHAASYYLRNRICLSADLSHQAGVDLVRELARIVDVVVENFAPRTLPGLGLGYETLRRLNPALIMLSLPAAGLDGPWRDRLTQGPSLSALYGRASLIGYPGEAWPRADTAEGDPLGASFGFIAVMAALAHRDKTGEGQQIDLAQGEALLAVDAEAVLEYSMNGRTMGFRGNRSPTTAPHGIYPCAGDDHWIAISAEDEVQYQALLACMGPAGTSLGRYRDAFQRLRAYEEIDEAVAAWTVGFDRWQLTYRLQAAGVPAYPVLDARGQLDDPHLQYRRPLAVESDVPMDIGNVAYTNPWKLERTPARIRRTVANIGADNDFVLRDLLGKSKARIEKLTRDEVLV